MLPRISPWPVLAAPATERTPAPVTPRADSAVGDTLLAQALLAHADLQGLAVAVKSADDGCYLSGNAAFAGLCGSDPTAVPGRTDADWLDATTAALLRAADHTALAQAAPLSSDHKFDLRGERREFKVLRLASAQAGRRLLVSIWQDMAPTRQRDAQLRLAVPCRAEMNSCGAKHRSGRPATVRPV